MIDNFRQRFIKVKQEFLILVRRESYTNMRSVKHSVQDTPSQAPNDFGFGKKPIRFRFKCSAKVLA